jgi:general stress protein 26
MSEQVGAADQALKGQILAVLAENRLMSIATVRPDGWPQATIVGYVNDDLDILFAIARNSQKFENITREPRVSIAIGQDSPDRIRGLSLAGWASEVTKFDEIEHLNALLAQRYPEQTVFAPREVSVALMRVTPKIISVIDHSKGPGRPELVAVTNQTAVHRLG